MVKSEKPPHGYIYLKNFFQKWRNRKL